MESGHGAMLLGLLTGLAVGGLVILLLFRKKILDCTFDERQERARGVAFQYGFFALLLAMLVYGVSELVWGRWCDAMAGCCFCVMAGMMVFAVTCILKDAYLSLREKPRYVMSLFALLSAVNLWIGGIQLLHGAMVEDGILTFRVTNLAVGAMLLVILIVYAVNFLLSRQEGEAE